MHAGMPSDPPSDPPGLLSVVVSRHLREDQSHILAFFAKKGPIKVLHVEL
jgi:hypothetical protein